MHTRRLASFVVGALLALGLHSVSSSFEFDVWRSGMELSEILNTARDHDLPIAASSFVHIQKHYNDELARKDAGKHSSYKYETRLLGWPARVSLQLTPYGRELHTLDVTWHTTVASARDCELLEANLTDILSRKYGAFTRPVPGNLGDPVLRRGAKQWSPTPTDRVCLERRSGGSDVPPRRRSRHEGKGGAGAGSAQAAKGRAGPGGRRRPLLARQIRGVSRRNAHPQRAVSSKGGNLGQSLAVVPG